MRKLLLKMYGLLGKNGLLRNDLTEKEWIIVGRIYKGRIDKIKHDRTFNR